MTIKEIIEELENEVRYWSGVYEGAANSIMKDAASQIISLIRTLIHNAKDTHNGNKEQCR